MLILRTVREMREACGRLRRIAEPGAPLGLVPTMGALHEGHLSLVRAAKGQCGVVAVSIFVNPTQFGAGEDFARYPRTFEKDCATLEGEGVDVVFAPTAEEMYPGGARTVVEVQGVGDRLDGVARPGHFKGVATVVAKLFHVIEPDRSYFGQKDAAQVAVLRAMVRDLDFAVEVVVCPTVRDADGLALSSRNRYLSAEERRLALALPRALELAAERWKTYVQDAESLRGSVMRRLEMSEGLTVEYVEVVDPVTLERVTDMRKGGLVAAAVHVGKTRLIDNVLLEVKR